jgi:hypothetical protein
VVAEPKGSTLLIPNLAIRHDAEPVPFTFLPHNLAPQNPSQCNLIFFYNFQVAFSKRFPHQNSILLLKKGKAILVAGHEGP